MRFYRGKDFRQFPTCSVVALDDSLRAWICPETPMGWDYRIPWWGVHHSELARLDHAEEARLREVLGVPLGHVRAQEPESEPLPDGCKRWVP